MDDNEKESPSSSFPVDDGRHLTTSLTDLELRARTYLEKEQGKSPPDSALIALLCDTVRVCREYADMMDSRRRFLAPVKKNYQEGKRRVKTGRLLKGYPKVVIHRHLKKKGDDNPGMGDIGLTSNPG